MFGTALRLLVGSAGDHLRNVLTKYLVLSLAGMAFLGAIVFAILAGFWALSSQNHDPIISAGIMAGILALVGGLIALIAYGITRKPQQSVSQAIHQPVQALRRQAPAVDDVGRQIEYAVRKYGPIKVATAAAAVGLIAGLLARRYSESGPFSRDRRNGRRHARKLLRDLFL